MVVWRRKVREVEIWVCQGLISWTSVERSIGCCGLGVGIPLGSCAAVPWVKRGSGRR
jgi:hypothetical protein